MTACCIGGVCIPYTAIVPLFLLALKWVGMKLALLGLIPKDLARKFLVVVGVGVGVGVEGEDTSSLSSTSCCERSTKDCDDCGKATNGRRGNGGKAVVAASRDRVSKRSKRSNSSSSSCTDGNDGNSSSHSTTGEITVRELASTEEWSNLILRNDHDQSILVVKFTASWCKPCKAIEPFYQSLATKYDATFVTVDVDELDDIAAQHDVAMMPTFVVLKGVTKAGSLSGTNQDKLERLLADHCPLRARG